MFSLHGLLSRYKTERWRKPGTNSIVPALPLGVNDADDACLDFPSGPRRISQVVHTSSVLLSGCSSWRLEQHELHLSVSPNEDFLP